jgi:putative phage-type endonuclease
MSNTDSEFFPESDTTSTASGSDDADTYDCDTADDESCDSSVQTISLDDYAELTITAYEILDDYVCLNVRLMSSPHFYTNMIEHTTDLLYTDVHCSFSADTHRDEYDQNLRDELREFVEKTTEVWMDMSCIPRRSFVQSPEEIPERTPTETIIMIARMLALQAIPQPQQKSREWYEYRYNFITASNLWKLFGSPAQLNSLIYEKCKPIDLDLQESRNACTEGPLHWGVKYEPVTVQIYEHMYDTMVGDFGCIPHPKYPFIGASPDGINIDPKNNRYGRMLEIKNIVNREITGIPKEEYWIQTQIQMETCGLDECDFVETRFKEYETEDAFYNDTKHEYRGVILQFILRPPSVITEQTHLSNKPYYVYMPLTNALDRASIQSWTDEQRTIMARDNKVLFAQKYWYLDEFSCVVIPRNGPWFSRVVPYIQYIWNIILKERVTGYEHRASKKRVPKERSMSLVSEDGDVIAPRPDAPVCLIRLDEEGNVC